MKTDDLVIPRCRRAGPSRQDGEIKCQRIYGGHVSRDHRTERCRCRTVDQVYSIWQAIRGLIPLGEFRCRSIVLACAMERKKDANLATLQFLGYRQNLQRVELLLRCRNVGDQSAHAALERR